MQLDAAARMFGGVYSRFEQCPPGNHREALPVAMTMSPLSQQML
jgi:hypothetical protein